MEPVQVGEMMALGWVFEALANAGSFKDFKERMSRLGKSIDWELPYGSALAGAPGEKTLFPDEYCDLPF